MIQLPFTKSRLLSTQATGGRAARGLSRVARIACVAGTVLLAFSGLTHAAFAAYADGSSGNSGARTTPYTVHWMVDTSDMEVRWGTGTDWQARTDFGTVPMRRDMLVLYEHWFALDVRTDGVSTTQHADYYTRYARTIELVLNERVPRGFDGVVCIDIEFLTKFWGDRTGGPGLYPTINYGRRYYDEWYDYVRTRRPEMLQNKTAQQAEDALAQSFEGAVREWFTFTINKMKELRPGTKFGFYGVPWGCRHGQYARPDPNPDRQANDRLQWMVDIADCHFLPLYQNRFTIPQGQVPANWFQMTIAQSRAWISDNIIEAKRLNSTIPVYVLAYCRYPVECVGKGNEWLDDLALDSMFRFPKEYGADGVVIWDHISNEREFNAFQAYLTQRVWPILNEIADRPAPPPSDPPPSDPPPSDPPPSDPPPSDPPPTDPPPSDPPPSNPPPSDPPPSDPPPSNPPPSDPPPPPPPPTPTPPPSPPPSPTPPPAPPPADPAPTPPPPPPTPPPAPAGDTGDSGEQPPAGGGSPTNPPPPADGGSGSGGGTAPGTGTDPGTGGSSGGDTGGSGSGSGSGSGGVGTGGGGSPSTPPTNPGPPEVPVNPVPPAGPITPPLPPESGSGGGDSGRPSTPGAGGGAPPTPPTVARVGAGRRLGVARAPKAIADRPKTRVVGNTQPLKRANGALRISSTPTITRNRPTRVVPLKAPQQQRVTGVDTTPRD